MKQSRSVLVLAALLATLSWPCIAPAQPANPTAVRPMQLSAFGGVSGVSTGLAGGKNFSITSGADLALPPWRGIRPALEVRGVYPTDRGLVDSQKSIAGGLKVETLLNHRIHPYGDFLFGRGEMNYYLGDYPFNGFDYYLSTTNIYSVGGGLDYDLTDQLSLKVDGQIQRWGAAPTNSGVVNPVLGTVGIVYRFGFDRHIY